MGGFILKEVEGHVAVLTFNSPETRNALAGPEQFDAVLKACEEITASQDIRAVILTGAGSAFSAGGDINAMARRLEEGHDAPDVIMERYRNGIQKVIKAIYDLPVPTIAAVNGPAIGVGLDFACACDIRLSADNAVFASSFVKLGIVPGDGGAWFLPRAVGASKAAELMFTGDRFDAEQAKEFGVVSQVVPLDDLLPAARKLATRIAKNPPTAVRMSKRLQREAQFADLDSLLEMSASYQAIAHHTQEHADAVQSVVAAMAAKKR